jgi:hypothetical protein
MPHPSDASLHLTLGRAIDEMLVDKIERLIRKPDERTAGYIDALRDIQRLMNGGDVPPLDFTTPPTQER